MATHTLLPSKSPNHDLISELPEEIKHRILEFLPTYEVARTCVLSKHWNDVWLQHHRLVFDRNLYLKCIRSSQGNKKLAFSKIIHDVLSRRTRFVKSFTLKIDESEYIPQQNYIDQWCVMLCTNGVEELNLLSLEFKSLRLPVCVVSCESIKRLKLCGFNVENPLNSSCIFPNVTSLFFELAWFNKFEIDFTIPNVETIGFDGCYGFDRLKLSAPKLENMVFLPAVELVADEWEFLKLYWSTIETLCFFPNWLVGSFCGERNLVPEMFLTAMNLHTLQLCHFSFKSGKYIELAVQMLRKCPSLCQLEIDASISILGSFLPDNHTSSASRLLENPESFSIGHNLERLRIIKIKSFGGSKLEMLFVRMILSKSPALDKLIITRGQDINASKASKVARQLLRLPRASQRAQVDFVMQCPHDLVSVPNCWD